ncbi:hypothetical protein BDV25DRAFT_127750 [Aspergillus avenaceus]|uniref:Uncharacterized protein n=1 Tax=Aspergillus avenaceus TaxID=36643 RepID=A0A5N6U2L1_ASPAV|nr:hypothetical protein BDV25DRAFT_127750 [Aspergillus avenaceus]
MPDPAELPLELYGAVLDLALESDSQHLCGLALLNRKWHMAILDRIYRKWTFNGARHSFMTLWKFVRTILSNPGIAALVRTLDIGNWGFYPHDSQPDSHFQLIPDEEKLVHNAIQDAGLNDLGENILASLSKRDRRPLIVLLLASLPNLLTLYAHVPPSDPILGAFMERILERLVSDKSSCPLVELKELYLFPEVPPLEPAPDADDRLCLKLDHLWPAFYLTSLRTLSLFDLDPHKAAEYLGHHAAVSHVENLYLVGYWGSVFTQPNIQALLTLLERLKRLFLHLYERVFLSEVSNSDIWDCLRKHKDSLQNLDIYRNGSVHSHGIGHFGSFSDVSLMSLGVQAKMLLGEGSPFRLHETLPPTIQALTLYGSVGYNVVPDLSEQIEELLEAQVPDLKSITPELEAVSYDDGKLMERYQQLKDTCAKKGINLSLESGSLLPKGGSCRELWTETFYMRDDGGKRYMAALYMPKRLRDTEELLLKSLEAAEADRDDQISDSEDEYGPFTGGTLKVHTVPFIDHRNRTAYMVFQNLEPFPLPPLYSFAMYFTDPAATPENTNDMVDLYQQLTSDYGGGGFDIRFDMYFLPSATHEDCISHYRSEKATRGSYLDQVRMFEQCDRDEVHPLAKTGQVPGMVDRYHVANQVLYICSETNWRVEQMLCVLKFNELPDANTDTTPAFRAVNCPMSTHSPSYDFATSEYPVEGDMFVMAHWDRECWLGVWQKATSRGWTGW